MGIKLNPFTGKLDVVDSPSGDFSDVELDQGTAAAPSISFNGDPNTGIYSPGADQLAISTNGTGRLFVDSSGRVGVGTASPSYVLDVATNEESLIKAERTGVATGAAFQSFKNTGGSAYIGVDSSAGNRLYATGGAAYALSVVHSGAYPVTFGTNNVERLRITSDGKLGLGSSTPDALLTVNGISSFGAGAVGTPSIARSGDLDTGFWFPAANTLAASTAGTERIRVDGSGNVNVDNGTFYVDAVNNRVSIGTTSPAYPLEVAGTITAKSNERLSIIPGANASDPCDIETGGGSAITFSPEGNEALRIDTSGRLLVGTSSARSDFYNASTILPVFQIQGAGNNRIASITAVDTGSASGPGLVLAKSRGVANTIVQSGDNIGGFSFQGADGTEFVEGARISANVDGTPGANDMPGRLVFSTTADGSASPTERMRIDSSGRLLVGTAAVNSNIDNLIFRASGNTQLGSIASIGRSGADYDGIGYNIGWQETTGTYKYVVTDTAAFIKFGDGGGRIETFTASSGTAGNSISFTAGPYVAQGGTSWTSSSDERLKEDLSPIENGLTKVNTLRAVTGRFKTDDLSKRRSFLIAQDVQEVLPEAVDTVDPESLGLDYVAVIPLLVAALKESKQRIETLEQRLTDAGIA